MAASKGMLAFATRDAFSYKWKFGFSLAQNSTNSLKLWEKGKGGKEGSNEGETVGVQNAMSL